jgi:outer membrane protein OmpA-like peptidoglycan-associated protein
MTHYVSAANLSRHRAESPSLSPASLISSLLLALLLTACASTAAPPVANETAATGQLARSGPAVTGTSAATPATGAAPASAPAVHVPESDRIYFASGSADVDAAGEGKLREHAERLRADSKLVVLLVGHTDPAGSRSYNLAVADRRTAAVARLLQAQGVSRKQIRRQNVGSTPTTPSCRTQDCQKLMRRVDIVYAD